MFIAIIFGGMFVGLLLAFIIVPFMKFRNQKRVKRLEAIRAEMLRVVNTAGNDLQKEGLLHEALRLRDAVNKSAFDIYYKKLANTIASDISNAYYASTRS